MMTLLRRAGLLRSFSTTQFPDIFQEKNRLRFADKASRMKPLRRTTNKDEDPSKQASVLIPLVTVKGEPSLLFTTRSLSLNAHRGEICYPGGKFDEHYDKSIEDAALRETEEELGIDRKQFEIWAKLPSLPSRDGKTGVTPVVARLKDDLNTIQMKLNPDEVADVFTCSIEQFCCPQNQGYTQFRSGYTMPVFFWSHATPQPKIWGLTAIITHQVLSVLVPEHYKLKLHFVAKVKSQT